MTHGYRSHRDHVAAGRLLRVVNYHNTPRSGRDGLRAELEAYRRHFVGLDLADVDRFFTDGVWADDRPGFLPVFYEGYANHVDVAAPVCEELGLTGWFAVCTGFVDCPPAEQEAFARSHWIVVAREETDGRRLAMTWDNVVDLDRRHVVFPHTSAHEGIAETVSDVDLEREVAGPKRLMDARTGGDAAVFAWMGGTPHGASARHDRAVVDAGYRYVVSNTMIQRVSRPAAAR